MPPVVRDRSKNSLAIPLFFDLLFQAWRLLSLLETLWRPRGRVSRFWYLPILPRFLLSFVFCTSVEGDMNTSLVSTSRAPSYSSLVLAREDKLFLKVSSQENERVNETKEQPSESQQRKGIDSLAYTFSLKSKEKSKGDWRLGDLSITIPIFGQVSRPGATQRNEHVARSLLQSLLRE